MEVAGLVLGVIPLVIKALHTYRAILSSMKSAQRDLGDMILTLITEEQILQNTCQILLKDIVPHSQLAAVTADPFGSAWKTYDNEIKMRLHQSSAVFQKIVTDMKEAVDELQQKLAVTDDGGTKFNSRRSLRDALKRSAREASFAMSFTLKKKDYVIILDRIKNGNIALQRLADQNRELEPTRRSGSQFQLARLIRDLSQGIFKAFRNVLECNCTSHDLGLEIDMRKATMPFGQEQDAIAKSLQFDIVVTMDDQIHAQSWKRWDRIRVQLADTDLSPDPTKLHGPSSPLSPSPRPRFERRVKFAPVLDSHSSDRTILVLPDEEHISSQLPVHTSKSPLVPSNTITNLCRLLQKGKGAISDCYGSITDTSRKFNLYAQRCHPETSIAVQLRKILEEDNQVFDYPERLKVALLLSYSVFHHYNTPWLAKIITVDDILFFRQQSTKDIHASDFLDKPLLTKQLLTNQVSTTSASTYCTAKPHSSNSRRINWTLLSLAFLLIQIIMGSTVKDLDITSEMDFDCLLSKQEVASKLCEGRLMLMHGGLNYTAAARWCLKNFLNGASLEDEKFCHEFHAEVIDRLEVDLGHQTIEF